MFTFLNSFNSQHPSLQVISQHKELTRFQSHANELKKKLMNYSSVKSSQKQSAFTSKQQQKSDERISPIKQFFKEMGQKVEENSLKKIKKYSKVLDASNPPNKMYHSENPSINQIENIITELSDAEILRQQSLAFDIQKKYHHYALKNQRKNRILAKAKQLGKSNFYKFLKEGSIMRSNKHMHRLYSQSKYQDSSLQRSKQMSPQQLAPIVVSFQPNKNEFSIQRKKKKLDLPPLLEKHIQKEKITLKTQSVADPSFCLTTEGSSLSLKKIQSSKKNLIRSLTEIKQKLRKNKKIHQQKDSLLFHNQNLSMREEKTYLSKWKYKSLFDQGEPNSPAKKVPEQKKTKAARLKTFTHHESKRDMDNLSSVLIKNEDKLQNKLKFLKISRSKLLKKQFADYTISRNVRFQTKNVI